MMADQCGGWKTGDSCLFTAFPFTCMGMRNRPLFGKKKKKRTIHFSMLLPVRRKRLKVKGKRTTVRIRAKERDEGGSFC